MTRLEIVYEKGQELRYLSHLELMRAFERAVRRARVPMEYSQGFNPRPKIVHASALGVGMTSECERAHLRLAQRMSPDEVGRALSAKLPPGLVLRSVRELPESAKPSYGLLDRAEYVVTLWQATDIDALRTAVNAFMAQDSVVVRRTKEGRTQVVNIRPFVADLMAVGPDEVRMELVMGGEGRAKPLEVLAALGIYREEDPLPRVHKTQHYQHRTRRRSAVRRR